MVGAFLTNAECGKAYLLMAMVRFWFHAGNSTVPQNTYNLLTQSIEEVWSAPQWEIARTCHDCKVLGCIWYSSQPVTTFAKNYMNGLSKMIAQQKPEYMEKSTC